MMIRRSRFGWAMTLAFAGLVGVPVLGCGNTSGAKMASVTPGPMPEGEEWTGVYYNELYGNLHIVEEGSNIIGRWKRANQSHWGELSGTKEGNVVRFQWKEHQYGQVGPQATTSGKGYFVYKLGENKFWELHGELGEDADETGHPWKAIKQTNKKANLDEIKGELGGSELPAVPEEWDKKNEDKKPEPKPEEKKEEPKPEEKDPPKKK
jgi:hypothetical protein